MEKFCRTPKTIENNFIFRKSWLLFLGLCAGKTHEQIELLELDKSGIHIAEYITTLPLKAELQKKLHQPIEFARERFVNNDE